jgi:hypothetical protein
MRHYSVVDVLLHKPAFENINVILMDPGYIYK